jgi:EmrB/QacA subfamily drug resistance transporter
MTSTPDNNAYKNKWAIMAAVSMGIFLATIDGSIVNVALPTLETELHTTFSLVQWVVVGYLLVITTMVLTIGRWADMVGKKKIYTAGFIIFTLGSLACGLAPNIYFLIGARILQSIGGSMEMALGTAITTENFPPSERGKALGISGLMVSLGIIAGPTIGGIILGSLSWHWIFFVNLPIGLIGIFMVIRFVPNVVPGIRQKFDFLGAIVLLICLSSLTIGLTIGELEGFNSILVYGLLISFVLFLAGFIYVESRVDQPMIDLGLFSNRFFTINLVTGFLTFMASAATTLLMPYYLENARGYSPETTGLMMAVVPLALGIVAPISGSLSDRVGARPLTLLGLSILLFGYICVSTLTVHTTTLGYALRFLPVGLGAGIFQSPNNSEIMSSAPRERLGVASGLLSLSRTLGQTTGISILGALWTSQVVAHMGGVVIRDATVAPPAIQVAALQNTTHAIILGIAFALGLSAWAFGMKIKQNRTVSARSEEK